MLRLIRKLQKKLPLFAFALLAPGAVVHAAPAGPGTDWVRLEESTLDFLYVRRNADLGGFDRVIIDPLSVWHAGSPRTAQSADLARLRREYSAHFEASMKAHGYAITGQPAANTLRLHVELIDLKVTEPGMPVAALADRFMFTVQPGKITLVAELQDATTGEVLLRFADLENGSGSAGSVWDEVDSALVNWSTTLANTMNQLGSTSADKRMARRR